MGKNHPSWGFFFFCFFFFFFFGGGGGGWRDGQKPPRAAEYCFKNQL